MKYKNYMDIVTKFDDSSINGTVVLCYVYKQKDGANN